MPGSPQDPSTPFKRRVLTAAMIVTGVLVLLYFLWQAVYVLLLIFAGVLVAVLLRSAATALAGATGLSVGWSLAAVTVALAGALVLLICVAAPSLSTQFEQLAEDLPRSIVSLKERVSHYKWGRLLLGTAPTTQEMEARSSEFVWRAGGFLGGLFNGAVALIVIGFVGIYLAAEPELYTNGLLRLLPRPHRDKGAEVLGAVRYTLQWWLIGQAVTMVIIGVLTAAGLWLLGVPLWLLLGVLAALFNFIPNFGPLISMIPAVLLALAISPGKAMWVVVLFMVTQNLEGNILTPLIQRRVVLLPPALTIVSQVLLGVTVGALGIMVAAPLTAAALVIIKMLYVEETLGDDVETPGEDLPKSELPPVPK